MKRPGHKEVRKKGLAKSRGLNGGDKLMSSLRDTLLNQLFGVGRQKWLRARGQITMSKKSGQLGVA